MSQLFSVLEKLYCSWIYWLLIKIFLILIMLWNIKSFIRYWIAWNIQQRSYNMRKNTLWGWRPVLLPQNNNFCVLSHPAVFPADSALGEWHDSSSFQEKFSPKLLFYILGLKYINWRMQWKKKSSILFSRKPI